MSVSEVAAPPKKRSFLRIWLPLLILVAGSAAVAVIRFGPFPEWEAANRNVSVMFTVLISSALLLLWFVLFSGIRWVLRLAVSCDSRAGTGGHVASVRNVSLAGICFRPGVPLGAPLTKTFWSEAVEKATDVEALRADSLDTVSLRSFPSIGGGNATAS